MVAAVALNALSLTGPAVGPIAAWVQSIHGLPSLHLKGSLNFGIGSTFGLGAGLSFGCGGSSSCGNSKKKSTSCGGGGGGCGKSKKKSCSPTKYKVVFKDLEGEMIDEIQQVEKQGSAEAPWTSQTEIEESTSKYKKYDLSPKYVFSRWSNYDWMNVENDLEVNAVYRNTDSGKEVSCTTELLENKITREIADEIQNFSDEYLNQQAEESSRGALITKNSTGYITRVTTYGKYNRAINMCIENVEYVTHRINSDMDTLLLAKSECTDWSNFNNLKNCLLNIQTTFVYTTRMAIYLDLQDIYTKIIFDVDDLMDTARSGESIENKIKEYGDDLDLDLEFFETDNTERLNEFIESYNNYVDSINKCFPQPPLEKINN